MVKNKEKEGNIRKGIVKGIGGRRRWGGKKNMDNVEQPKTYSKL